MRKIIAMTVLSLSISLPVMADPVKDFLITCGYGTLAGALAGVVSVAFSENPSEKSMNIARGASLGLYVGIGYGLYQANHPANTSREVKLWLEPLFKERRTEGLQVRWIPATF